jgi:hypothetical protein
MKKRGYKTHCHSHLVHLVAEHHKGKLCIGITKSRQSTSTDLFQKLFSPVFQMIQRMRIGHVVHQQTGIGTTIESHTQTLKSFLSGRVPDLQTDQMSGTEHVTHNDVVLGEKIGPDGGLVLSGKSARGIAIHQGRLADAAVTQNDNLECLFLTGGGGTVCGHFVIPFFFNGEMVLWLFSAKKIEALLLSIVVSEFRKGKHKNTASSYLCVRVYTCVNMCVAAPAAAKASGSVLWICSNHATCVVSVLLS